MADGLNLSLDTMIYAFLGGLLPAIFWLWFWLKEDRAHPEPPMLIAAVFVAGIVAVVPAYFLQKVTHDLLAPLFGQGLTPIIFLWALIEETLKFLAVYLMAFRRRAFDEPVDAMVYMITGALGFAAIENSLFLLSILTSSPDQTPAFPLLFLLTGNLRFLGATIVHVVSSSILGGWIGLAFYQSRRRRHIHFILGILTATILHALFNYFIITSDSEDVLKIFILLWAAAIFVLFFFERVKGSVVKFNSQRKK